jgi:hypothetical protein
MSASENRQHPPGISAWTAAQRITLGFDTREMFEAYLAWLGSGAAHEDFSDWANGGVEYEQARAERRNARRCPCSSIVEPHSYGDHER